MFVFQLFEDMQLWQASKPLVVCFLLPHLPPLCVMDGGDLHVLHNIPVSGLAPQATCSSSSTLYRLVIGVHNIQKNLKNKPLYFLV